MGQRTRAAIRAVRIRLFGLGLLLILTLAASSPASARSKGAEQGSKVVDSGTFSILIDGRKVGTETFSIRQLPDVSIASSEIKIDDGTHKARQTSEFRLTPHGELQRYEWRELAPGKSEIVVESKDEFLVEHITSEKDKKFEQPFLLPASTLILDDFFFSHREILIWRYLASICKPVNGVTQCASQKSQFGVIVPRQHASSVISIEYVGRDSVPFHGGQPELSHFRLTSDDFDVWDLWLDDNKKLVRILIASTKTEVVRD
jgi:hypothetical protein